MMALFKWLGDNISFVVRKWATYVFRRRDPLTWLIKWWSFSLAGELGQSIADKRLGEIFDKLRIYIGDLWTDLIEVISNIILFNFDLGFTWLNISLKFSLVVFGAILIAWRDKKRIVQVISARVDFDITKEWLESMYTKHFTREIQSKYNSDLYEDQSDLGVDLLNEIDGASRNKLLNELRILDEWLNDFEKAHQEMIEFFGQKKIDINEGSNQSKQFRFLNSKLAEYRAQIESSNEMINSGIFSEITSIDHFVWDPKLKNSDYKRSFIERYPEDDKYLVNPPGEEEWYVIEITFRRYKEIVQQIRRVNSMLESYSSNAAIIYGDAGMGKSNLSAYLTNKLQADGKPVVFVKAKSFSGNPDEFESIFLNNLDVPEGYSLTEVLDLMNAFGSEQNCNITIIIDGLNETSYETSGFSPIWQKHLDDFLSRIINYPNIFIVATLRRSYIDRIWSTGDIPIEYNSIEMLGFDGEVIEGVVENYFEEYNITHGELSHDDIFYFRTPLLLSLYCQMRNPKKAQPVSAILGLEGFRIVFDEYIDTLAKEIKSDLSLKSTNGIYQGFAECSALMIDELQAFVINEEFYKLFDGEEVTNVNDTIAHKILEGYLIYIEDSVNRLDVITHTQQEVGGYLLAQRLIETHENIEQIIASDFFQNHIIGANKHLLADDILKFLTVDSAGNELVLSRYGDQPVIRNFVLNKIQREKKDDHLIQLKDNLIERSRTEGSFDDILNISKTRFLEVNSALNILEVKNELLNKMPVSEFEMTWTRFLYDNWPIISDFITDCEKMAYVWKRNENLDTQDKLRIELLVLTLESTMPEFRERVSKVLVEVGTVHPDIIFDKLIEFAKYNRLYAYEKLAAISYGICLRKQNDDEFCQDKLAELASTVFELQFMEGGTYPTFHYIVIDSFKHIIDLANRKGVFNWPEGVDLNKYQFPLPDWTEITEAHRTQLNECVYSSYDTHCPDPLRMDFVIYTIPRLVREDVNDKLTATANVFNRLTSNGYNPEFGETIEDDTMSRFYWGSTPFNFRGKVERVGKKYSWNAFYEYAGFLLSRNELPVWSEYDQTNDQPTYERLGDNYFEVSQPRSEESEIKTPVYEGNLLDVRNENAEWVNIERFDVLNEVRKKDFIGKEFTLLHGYLEYKIDAEYKVRSLLFCESFLVRREDIQGSEAEIHGLIKPWEHELSTHGYLTNVYFGELYWADTVPDGKRESLTIYLNEEEEYEKTLDVWDDLEAYPDNKRGDKVLAKRKKQIHIEGERTVVEYLWESNSEVPLARGYNEYIPYFTIGKYLNLRADSETLQLLDHDLEIATKRVDWNNSEKDKQRLTYLRSDLLQRYLDENDLVMLYQVKQFTHDQLVTGDGSQVDMRKIKYYLPHLMD